jgi:hypothetical protein
MKTKIDWTKLFVPNTINLEKMDKMTDAELKVYFNDIKQSELARLWVNLTYSINYLCYTNSWQYVLAIWLLKY